MLKITDIDTFYGSSQVLYKVCLTIKRGEVVSLLGRNGMGKSTTVKSIIGLSPIASGSITFNDIRIDQLQPFKTARCGIGLVPEGRHIFPNLTVFENLMVARSNFPGAQSPYRLEDIITIFPRLGERLSHYGNQLSGGEQQMLAIGRALMINPQLLLLDEATEGLAPLIRKEIWRGLRILKSKGLSILVIDKNIDSIMEIAAHHHIMEKGRIVWSGETREFRENHHLKARYLGV